MKKNKKKRRGLKSKVRGPLIPPNKVFKTKKDYKRVKKVKTDEDVADPRAI